MLANFLRFIVAATAAVVLAGCATRATTIDAQWINPSLAGKRELRNVLVLGSLRDTTQRRMLEDRMVDALAAAGVKAVASYKFLPEADRSPRTSCARRWRRPARRTCWPAASRA